MNQPRNKLEALLGAKYEVRVHELHCRFYSRVRGAMTVASLVAGSAAIVSVFQQVPGVIAAMGVIVAAIGYIDAVGNISALAERHSMWTRTLARFVGRAERMAVEEIDAERAELTSDMTIEIESLRSVAYNDTLKSLGYEEGMRPESGTQKLVRAVAA